MTRDLTLGVHVRRALLEDPALGPLNLGIKVRDGNVVLVGPVPSAELAHKAIQKVGKVRGVQHVKSELYLARGNEREPIQLPLTEEPPTQTQSASPDPTSGSLGTLTGRVPPIALPPSGRTAAVPPVPAPPPPAVSAPAAPAAIPSGSGVSLLAPVVEPSPAPPAASPAAADSLTAAVERVRQGDPRFRRIHVEVRGTTLLLNGADVPGEHVMALAQALSVLPGVERVRVQSSPSPGR